MAGRASVPARPADNDLAAARGPDAGRAGGVDRRAGGAICRGVEAGRRRAARGGVAGQGVCARRRRSRRRGRGRGICGRPSGCRQLETSRPAGAARAAEGVVVGTRGVILASAGILLRC